MLAALRFVHSAVSVKQLVPVLRHYRIQDGRVTGFNGRMSISCPIGLDLSCCPLAVPFAKAIETCEGTASLSLSETGRLVVKSGKFRAVIDTVPADQFPAVQPAGTAVASAGPLLPALRLLEELLSEDASRPWAAGVLLRGDSAYATNNIVLTQYWLGYSVPQPVVIPRAAVRELLRIGEEPVGLQMDSNSVTFHYSGERWLTTQLIDGGWPDVEAMLAAQTNTRAQVPVPAELFDAVEALQPFVDDLGRVYLLPGAVATTHDDTGARMDVPGLAAEGVFNVKMLLLLRNVAERADFALFPRVPFFGARIRGLIMGVPV